MTTDTDPTEGTMHRLLHKVYDDMVAFLKVVPPFKDLPLADRGLAWDGDGAVQRLRRWASSDGSGSKEKMNWGKYAGGFLFVDPDNSESFGGYKLPFADIIDGRLTAVPKGLSAAKGALGGARGGVAIPANDKTKALSQIERYQAKISKTFQHNLDQVGNGLQVAVLEKQDRPTNERGWTAPATLQQVKQRGALFTQGEAGYLEPSDDSEKTCGACRFYLRNPDGTVLGGCQVVGGPIAWFATSKLFISATEEAEAVLEEEGDDQIPEQEVLGAGSDDEDRHPPGYVESEGPTDASLAIVTDALAVVDDNLADRSARRARVSQALFLDPHQLLPGDVLQLTIWRGCDDGMDDALLQEAQDNVLAELTKANPGMVIAMGDHAAKVLGDHADVLLPHPDDLRYSDSDASWAVAANEHLAKALEIVRKDEVIHKVHVVKVLPLRGVTIGVVTDPYTRDLQGDHQPPSDVEATAHDFMANSRTMGFRHRGLSNSVPVESSLFPYPSVEDYQAAMTGGPHRIYRFTMGDDQVHSGSWLLGAKHDPATLVKFLSGELGGYSIGGRGIRTPSNADPMANVTEVIEVNGDSIKLLPMAAA